MKAIRQRAAMGRMLTLILLFVLLPLKVVAQDSETVATAPLNPDFVNYVNSRGALKSLQAAATGEEHTFGYIPEPIDRSYLKGQQVIHTMALESAALPASYDLRTFGKVTPVRNQGSCGACWAFATMGSTESNLLPDENRDFSENNLKNTAGWNWAPCDGGNATMATAYLTRWSGPINESDDPYNVSSGVSPSGLSVQKHLQDVIFVPARSGPLDNDNIKQALMDYGAIYTSYYHNDSYYKSSKYGYYYNGSNSSNHAVTIVGWDDNFPRSSFSSSPPGNGAFIIKNSWGTGWGQQGFFYISYYDSKMGMDGSYLFKQAAAPTNFSRIYQYDPLGQTGSYGYGSNTGWFANVFTAAGDENLVSVAFYMASLNSSYQIYIYTNVGTTPTSGVPAGTTTGSITEAGYHTVQLAAPVRLTSGQKFSIVVKLTTPGYNYPISIESPYSGVVSPTASPGQSYVSNNGASWSDITVSYNAYTNVCLKGFASGDPPTVTTTSPDDGATGVVVNGPITATFSKSMNAASINSSSFTLNNGVSGVVAYDSMTSIATFTPSADLAYNTHYTATITTSATDADGNTMSASKTWSFTTAQQRDLLTDLSGNGSVNSSPSGIACTTGNSGTCSALYPSGESVTLSAAAVSSPTMLSHFGSWSGECDSTNGAECTVAMNGDKNITATFITNPPVYIPGVGYYNSLHDAYNTPGSTGINIRAQAVLLATPDFTLDLGKAVLLEGGYDSPYQVNSSGYTTMNGTLTVGNGSLTVENLIIR